MELLTTIQLKDMQDVDVRVEFDVDISSELEPLEFWGATTSERVFTVKKCIIDGVYADGDQLNDNDETVLKDGEFIVISDDLREELTSQAIELAEKGLKTSIW